MGPMLHSAMIMFLAQYYPYLLVYPNDAHLALTSHRRHPLTTPAPPQTSQTTAVEQACITYLLFHIHVVLYNEFHRPGTPGS
jgi:hypothetical protein